MAEFITGKNLSEEVYDIIFNASKNLVILSPYIKLDDYFKKEVFAKHRENPALHIFIVFGKNEGKAHKSFSQADFDYFKDFPNISIVYVPNLHAKYYANDEKGIVTSINLYDYSFNHNIEFGVLSRTKILGGSKIDQSAWEETMDLIEKNSAIFVKRPSYRKKMLIGKDYLGAVVLHDCIDDLLKGRKFKCINALEFPEEHILPKDGSTKRLSKEEFEKNKKFQFGQITPKSERNSNTKLVSASVLGRNRNMDFDQVITKMKNLGYIESKSKITDKGKEAGLKKKFGNGSDFWIVYPENLSDIL